MENDILFTIREKMPHMSKNHRKIAQYVLAHYDEAAFETAAKIGKRIGASESTVVRFAVAIGYDGYPEYQKALGEALRNRLSSVKKLDEQYGQDSQAELLRSVFSSDINNLQQTMNDVTPEEFGKAVDFLLEAEQVYLVGFRSSRILAELAYHYLKMAGMKVLMIVSSAEEDIVEELFGIGERDCLVAFNCSEYSEKMMLAAEIACDRRAKVISITDDEKSPVNLYASSVLHAKSDSVSVVTSMVAPMSLVNAVAVSICIRKQDEVGNNISEIKSLVDSYRNQGEI